MRRPFPSLAANALQVIAEKRLQTKHLNIKIAQMRLYDGCICGAKEQTI